MEVESITERKNPCGLVTYLNRAVLCFIILSFKTLSIDKDTCIYIFLIHNEKFFIKNIFGVGFNYRGEWGKYECKPYFKVFFEGSVGL